MSTHDPRQVIEDIRNHLAAHDRRLAFLFGAGTSSGVNIAPTPPSGHKPTHQPLVPGIETLTTLCGTAVAALGKGHADAWGALLKQCETAGGRGNVEGVLSRVRMKIDAIGDGERLVGLTRDELISTEKAICTTIAREVNVPENKIPTRLPHNEFSTWIKKANRTAPLELFTTNYDVLFEMALEGSRVPIFDGFVGTHEPFFYPESLDDDALMPSAKWIRLWKLHGSVNWRYRHAPSGTVIIRNQPSGTGELIFPSHRKYEESRKQPYMSYMDRLSRVLNLEHSLLITCGYSFSDEHINAIIYGALDNRGTTNVIALRFGDLRDTDDLVDAARRRPNLTLIGRNGGVISGEWGLWKLVKPVDDKTASFMDVVFDSKAAPEDSSSPAASPENLSGWMRLGDFNWFGRFLNTMGPSAQ